MLRIISYNVYFGKRLGKILSWLCQSRRADIICLQEYPQHEIASCVKILSDTPYHYRFAPSLKIRKRVYGQLTLFRTDKVQFVTSAIITMGTNRIEKTVLRNTISRNSLLTILGKKRKRFTVVNTHLMCLASNAIRYRQIQHIIDSIPKKTRRSIIVGDFNVSSILGRKKLFALMKNNLYKTVENRMATHQLLMIRHQLDYIFAKEFTVRDINVDHVRFSDHYPITAVVRLSH